MRPTLHEYNLQKLSDLDCTAISDVLNFTKLTNRAPRLGDFVPCDEEGNVLEEPENWHQISYSKPNHGTQEFFNVAHTKLDIHPAEAQEYQAAQDRVIFAGDWEVDGIGTQRTIIKLGRIEMWFEKNGDVYWFTIGKTGSNKADRIEDLPREIEFVKGVI
jgi:hypothetical protein